MYKWEELGISKEVFEVCEELAKAGLANEKINKCASEKADISELKCDSISKGDIESFVTIVGDDNGYSISAINKDSINLKVNRINNEKTVFEEVMIEVVDELEEELREIVEESSSEEELCLSCLIRFFLEKSYSEGYKEATKYFKDRIDEANQSIRDELLTEVVEVGYGD